MKKQTAQPTSDQRANHIYARGKVWNDIIQANADSACLVKCLIIITNIRAKSILWF